MGTEIGRGVVPVSLDNSGIGKGISGLQGLIGSKLGAVGKVGGAALVTGIAAVVGGGAALYKVGSSFKDMTNTIIVGTGASGKALKGLEASAMRVGKTTPSNFADVGTAIADVNTRLGLTGKPLEDVSSKFLNLSRITGTDLGSNIAGVSRAFGDWGVKTGQQSATLDKLFFASQATGAGVDDLSRKIVQFGAPLRQWGFSMDEAIAMFGKWEKEGVNAETVMSGFRIGLSNLARAGKEPAEEFPKLIKEIKGAGSAAEANSIAFEVFGSRAGADMAAAIREGRFEFDDLVASMGKSGGSIADADKRTRTITESWQLFKNRVMVPLRPIAVATFDAVGKGVALLSNSVGPAIKAVRGAFSGGGGGGLVGTFRDFGQTLVGVVGPGVKEIGALIQTSLLPAFRDAIPVIAPVAKFIIGVLGSAVIGAVKGAIQVIKGVVQVIAGVFNVISGLVTGDWKKAWKGVTQIVKGAVNVVVGAIKFLWNVGILAVFRKGIVKVLGSFKGMWKSAKSLVSKGVGVVKGLISKGFSLIGSIIKGLLRAHVAIIKGAWGLIRKAVSAGIGFVRSIVSKGMSTVRSVMSSAWSAARTLVVSAWTRMRSAVSTGISRVVSLVKGLPGKALGAMRGIGTKLYTSGVSLISGFLQGIRNKARDIVATIKSAITDKIPGFVKKRLGIASPSKVFRKIGQQTGEGMALGLADSGRLIERASANLVPSPRVARPFDASGEPVESEGGVKVVKQQFPASADPAATAAAAADRIVAALGG